MPNLINQSFFVREITLPNTGNAAVLEGLNSFISKYEEDCLLKILGYPLYKLFGTQILMQRMIDLRDGAEYTNQFGKLAKWQGLVHSTDISLIANYVYFYIQQTNASKTTGVNTSIPKGEKAINFSPADKMVTSWNFFSEETANMISFLWYKKDLNGVRVYPEFTYEQGCITSKLSRKINSFGI